MITCVNRSVLPAGLLLAAALLSGCASPEVRYYTLAREPAAGIATASISIQARQPMLIEVAPVRVPERLNRSNLLLKNANGSLKLMEQDRWLAPLPDELRDALSQQLQASLGAVDTYHQDIAGLAPLYRITIEVVNLDAEPGKRVNAIINWTVQRVTDGELTAGRTKAGLPVSDRTDSVVAAYQQIVASTAADIATKLRTLQP
ncbi:hypothetical protein LT85_3737 [Collimonas arenae]|uniref:ABC-type transport auxiliary lipoprotein component domain-containing protein n=1 Tax=Collimonas arenae TaxID=279058 RepID=A0A0A1FGQ0_9BURK|nr:PqiC family protein [Collimonas arenae]AIY42895.1 hypothetical protein LT85_3737 [Collimonas arenae]